MLTQHDPFREFDAFFGRPFDRSFDRMASEWATGRQPTAAMPMDAFRRGSDVWVYFDLPGVKAENLDITVERNVLTVTAERTWQRQDGDQPYFAERRAGTFRRQVQLGEGLDLEHLEADLHDGVLTIRIPVAERAKPRKVQVGQRPAANEALEASAAA